VLIREAISNGASNGWNQVGGSDTQYVVVGVGTVTVGIEHSQVQSGDVKRVNGSCSAGKVELTGEQIAIAGRTYRGGLTQ
jgi:hypothetical protein